MSEESYENIELRSEEVQEIMGYVPHWIVRWGITLVYAVLLLLIVGSIFFKYPDVVDSRVLITTTSPPAKVVAAISEKISEIRVKDEAKVVAGDILAVLRSSADVEDIISLKKELLNFRKSFMADRSSSKIVFKNYNLGELQDRYENLIRGVRDYNDFIDLDYYGNKIAGATDRLKRYKDKISVIDAQLKLKKRGLALGKRQFARAEDLHRRGILSKEAFDEAESQWLLRKTDYESVRGQNADIHIQAENLKESLTELKLKEKGERRKYEYSVKEAVDVLRSAISAWEIKFLLVAPVDGTVSFNNYWSVNHNVKVGETVMTVVPLIANKRIIGKVVLPIQRSGKVSEGQKVNIKIDNYPHMEYGMLNGIVEKISMVPSDNSYLVDISLPDELVTNYGKKLDFIEEMRGKAEIITDDMRLIERFINPLISLFKKNS